MHPRRLLGFLLVPYLLCSGCIPIINTYETPRTAHRDRPMHTLATGGFVDLKHLRGGVGVSFPVPATYSLRRAYAENADLGLFVAGPTSAAIDTKWNFFKSDSFDAAVAPALAYEYHLAERFWWHLPLMASANVSEELSLVFVQGVSRMETLIYADPENMPLFREDATYYRAGFGIDARATDHFALHPELTLMRKISRNASGDDRTLPLQMGIAVRFGALPVFP